jgi:hypothetical protein
VSAAFLTPAPDTVTCPYRKPHSASVAAIKNLPPFLTEISRELTNSPRFRGGVGAMVLRWTAAAMMEAAKGFRRLKAYKHLPALKAALASLQLKHSLTLEENVKAA